MTKDTFLDPKTERARERKGGMREERIEGGKGASRELTSVGQGGTRVEPMTIKDGGEGGGREKERERERREGSKERVNLCRPRRN
jgi:hypothetical protein